MSENSTTGWGGMSADVATALSTLRTLRERIEAHLAPPKVEVPLEDRVLAQLRERPQSKPQLARSLTENTPDVEWVVAALYGQGRVRADAAGRPAGYESYSVVEET